LASSVVNLYERDTIMSATSCASSKMLHGGLRYLENCEFRLVRESLRERDAWIRRAPHLATSLRLVMPIYRDSKRSSWMIGLGMFMYDHLAGRSLLPKAKRLSVKQLVCRDPYLRATELRGGFEYSDAQMDDQALGIWVAEQAQLAGARIQEHTKVNSLTSKGQVITDDGKTYEHDRLINVAGPWAHHLLQQSGLYSPYELDLVRGSHLILEWPCKQAYLLEAPDDRRVFFVLPWQGKTLVGTTEVRQTLEDPIRCSQVEQTYLLNAWSHYFPDIRPDVISTFAGLRPLIRSAQDPNKATREYAIYRERNLVSIFGGKWTTSLALAEKVSHSIH